MDATIIGLLIITFIASMTGWFFSQSKEAEKPVKVMIFVLYFWGSVFIQLMIFSVLYHYGLLDSIIE
ncbi:MAG: hypothetical protein KAH20_05300 [Methylococcales bacterium]|nr:hypothetical protein [Methylococcales bacterium]